MSKPSQSPESAPAHRNEAREIGGAARREQSTRTSESPGAPSPEETPRILDERRARHTDLERQSETLRQAQATLATEQARHLDFYNLAPVGYISVSAPGLIVEANLPFTRLLGVARSELLGEPIVRFILMEDQDLFAQFRHRLLAVPAGGARPADEPLSCELRMVKSDHTQFWAHLAATAAQDRVGAPEIHFALSDVTARRRAEEALQASEEKFRAIADYTTNWEIWLGMDGRILWVNPAVERMTGYTPAEIMAMPDFIATLVALEDRERTAAALKQAVLGSKGEDYELRCIQKNGSKLWLGVSWQPIFDPKGNSLGVRASVRDITAHKHTEARLLLQSNALDAAANAIVITDRSGVIEWANAAFTTFTGYTAAEAIGKNPGQLIRSGKQDSAFFHAMWATILAGQVWHGEIINRRKDGRLYTEEMTITPIRDEHGDIAQYIAVKQDITQRKLLEAQFRQAQKMDAIGQLAGGVAHDFNNILAAVLMYVGLLQDEPALAPATRSGLLELSKEIQRGAVLTRQLLAFSRQQAMEPKRLDLPAVVAGLLNMLRRLLGENITIKLIDEPGIPWVEADAGMIEQVVTNLCINARDAMPRGGQLTLRIETIINTPGMHPQPDGARPGRFVRLSVTDTGVGMSEETLQHIFEPFFTTKEAGKGTGLGLATVYGIVQQHRGWVTVTSTPGQGSTFHLHLPAGETSVSTSVADKAPPSASGRGETILLAEDEASLRTTLAVTLRRRGYKVLEASDGPAALQLWREHSAQIDLLLTDVIMPNGMSGQDLVSRLRAERPGLKVIASTGYSKQLASTQFPPEAHVTVLRKPYGPSELMAAVRASLDQT